MLFIYRKGFYVLIVLYYKPISFMRQTNFLDVAGNDTSLPKYGRHAAKVCEPLL